MRQPSPCCALILLALCTTARAAEPDLKAVIRAAIQAHGGEEKLLKYKAATVKLKGKIEVMGNSLDIAGEQSVLAPSKLRVALQFQVNNMNVDLVQVFDGKSMWIAIAGKTTEIKDKQLLDEMREILAVERVGGFVELVKKEYQLSPVGDVKVKDKEAIGVRVSKKGQRDINLYFDKKTRLLVKSELRARPPMGEKEVTQEKYFSDWKEVMGVQTPGRLVIEHDGQPYMDITLTDMRLFEGLDEGLFAKP